MNIVVFCRNRIFNKNNPVIQSTCIKDRGTDTIGGLDSRNKDRVNSQVTENQVEVRMHECTHPRFPDDIFIFARFQLADNTSSFRPFDREWHFSEEIFSEYLYIGTIPAVYPEHMKENLQITRGLVFSQRVLLALIDKGLTRQQAYQLVQRNAMKAWKERLEFKELLKADKELTAQLPPAELEALFDYQYYLRHIDRIFKRLGL